MWLFFYTVHYVLHVIKYGQYSKLQFVHAAVYKQLLLYGNSKTWKMNTHYKCALKNLKCCEFLSATMCFWYCHQELLKSEISLLYIMGSFWHYFPSKLMKRTVIFASLNRPRYFRIYEWSGNIIPDLSIMELTQYRICSSVHNQTWLLLCVNTQLWVKPPNSNLCIFHLAACCHHI